ncbi:MAG TPA: DUF4010 domain-containing protein, partial [Planctomycetota bacterium]|nr:DUF4010 domain-containing protein [Planctomycetota bacterium]
YLALLLVAIWRAARAASTAPVAPADGDHPLVRNPFALLPALKWGALLSAVFVLTYVLQRWFGAAGLLVTAGVAGLTDVDAVTLASSEQAHAGSLAVGTAALAVMLALLSNTVVKIVLSRTGGGPAYARTVGLPLAGAAGAAVLVALFA